MTAEQLTLLAIWLETHGLHLLVYVALGLTLWAVARIFYEDWMNNG